MVKIRLRRMGARNSPFYRIVVSDSRKVPTGAAIEEVGYYDPAKGAAASRLDVERVRYWLGRGAQMSSTVARLFRCHEESAA